MELRVLNRLMTAFLTLCVMSLPIAALGEDKEPGITTSHGITLFGELKYGRDFEHFDYANPDAPKGGTFVFGWAATFDSVNSFIVLGVPPAFRTLDAILYDRLMVRSGDEPASVYGLLAETISYPDDYAWAEFKLREDARFHDGEPVTVEDVIFSLETLKTQGAPQYRTDYADVAEVVETGPHRVRFIFTQPNNRSMLYTVAQLPVLAKHFWADREFNKPTLEAPLTSGPYRLTDIEPGKTYKLRRVEDYWAKNHPINKGRFNFDVIQHDYYRDISIEFESFMAGNADMRWETLPHQWVTGYDVPAVKDGRLIKEEFEYSGSTLYAGFYFNLRHAKFQDRRVREAIANAFDFEWLNKTILYGLFVRLRSHFDHTELANQGVPEGLELAMLEPFRDKLDPRIFTELWNPPQTDATEAGARNNLRKAAMLLRDAGYSLQDGKMVSADGQTLSIEILLWDPFWERVTAPFVANLKRLGIDAGMRVVERTEWFQRMETFEYEMTQGFTLPQPLSPGSEQREYWGSAAADQQGSNNWMGIKDPVVDALIEKVVYAPDRESRVAATRALDRVLCWGFYSIPYGYTPRLTAAYWNRFGQPELEPTWLSLIWYSSTWWVDPDKEAALAKAGGKKAK